MTTWSKLYLNSIVFFIAYVFISIPTARCQGYEPMLGSSNAWYATFQFEGCATWPFQTGADVVLNNKTYKSLNTYTTIGYLREDTVLRRVYSKFNPAVPLGNAWDSSLLAFNDTSEFVYFDFSLRTGDSIYIAVPQLIMPGPYYHPSGMDSLGWCYVDSVSTVATLVGSRRAIYLRSSPIPTGTYYTYYHMLWAEGIGALWGPYMGGGLNYLSCFYKDNVHVYSEDNTDTLADCFCVNGINDPAWMRGLSLTPSPTSGLAILGISGAEQELTATLYDVSGREVERLFTDQRGDHFSVDVRRFETGLYYVRVSDQDGRSTMLKLVRQ